MRASLTKMVGSDSLVSWRRSQARTFQFRPFYNAQCSISKYCLFVFSRPIVSLVYTQTILTTRLRKARFLPFSPENLLLTISRLSYLPDDIQYLLVVLYRTAWLLCGLFNPNLVMLESRQHQPLFGPGRLSARRRAPR